ELFNMYHKPTMMQADGGIAEDRGFLINNMMALVMGRNKYFLSSGKETDKYFNYYKVLSSKIYHYRFTTYNKQEVFSNYEMTKYKCEYRNKLSLKGDFIVFSVGQQIHRKGYDILAQAAIGLPEDIQIYIAGGEPNEETLQVIESNKLKNIHFIGFKSKEELFSYYAASDVFVMPTRYDIWGLVINEAMSFGLPIISTDKCVAALEFAQMADIGYIVKVDDVQEMHAKILELYGNKDLVTVKGNNSYQIIKDYHLENMCDDYKQAIYSIINKKG
ncbi:MAG: glycosyltransferase family 4 protein, partial [Erysipelotrichaceae bacterium]|nr:glycosyltransferase family 4 protein [Erysipelotrichaceae bacterium]